MLFLSRHTKEIAELEATVSHLQAQVLVLKAAVQKAYRDGQDAGPIHWHSIDPSGRIAELEAKLAMSQKIANCPSCGVGVAIGVEHNCI